MVCILQLYIYGLLENSHLLLSHSLDINNVSRRLILLVGLIDLILIELDLCLIGTTNSIDFKCQRQMSVSVMF
ncbi:hypothetical protein QVD17_27089 [Tagetes erecta]|uniref:Uncharacterized protein n=1 Tax=Tagetes erecta TaxID=13708 RepID=A0AAD8KA94_TARER|nr:hypothetical protein QVD17_27089 [Tagetes erecta]